MTNITKKEFDFLVSVMQGYIDQKFASVTSRGQILSTYFEEQFMKGYTGGMALDQSTFRTFLRECNYGKGISKVEKSTQGLVDTYVMTFTDGTTYTFTVTNGDKGDKGDEHFLSLWNSVTGLPTTAPSTGYAYKAGDYYIVDTVSGSAVNYKPSGSTYTGASTAVESSTVKKGDAYYYDGSAWNMQINTARSELIEEAIDDILPLVYAGL